MTKYVIEKKPVRFSLSKKQLASIVWYIDMNFKKELSDYKDKEEQKREGEIETYELPPELWAVIFIKDFIEKREIFIKNSIQESKGIEVKGKEE